jgi:hypothetical protein
VFLDYCHNPSGAGLLEDFSLNLLDEEARTYLANCRALLPTPIERLEAMNPPAVELFLSQGIDLRQEPLEAAVCAQHCNGGLAGNIWWESNVRHLFPVGEVNGTHGVRRPGGAALNAGQVGGIRAALFIAKRYNQAPPGPEEFGATVEGQVRRCLDFARRACADPPTSGVGPGPAVREIQERMSACAGHVRDPVRVTEAASQAWALVARLREGVRVTSPVNLPLAFRAVDLALTHAVYLEAIREYLEKGGQSRGSALVLNPAGQRPCDALGAEWRFLLNDPGAAVDERILEVSLRDEVGIEKRWLDIRPIPDDDGWFETVWDDFRNDRTVV